MDLADVEGKMELRPVAAGNANLENMNLNPNATIYSMTWASITNIKNMAEIPQDDRENITFNKSIFVIFNGQKYQITSKDTVSLGDILDFILNSEGHRIFEEYGMIEYDATVSFKYVAQNEYQVIWKDTTTCPLERITPKCAMCPNEDHTHN